MFYPVGLLIVYGALHMARVYDQYDVYDSAAITAFTNAGYGDATQIARWRAVYESLPACSHN